MNISISFYQPQQCSVNDPPLDESERVARLFAAYADNAPQQASSSDHGTRETSPPSDEQHIAPNVYLSAGAPPIFGLGALAGRAAVTGAVQFGRYLAATGALSRMAPVAARVLATAQSSAAGATLAQEATMAQQAINGAATSGLLYSAYQVGVAVWQRLTEPSSQGPEVHPAEVIDPREKLGETIESNAVLPGAVRDEATWTDPQVIAPKLMAIWPFSHNDNDGDEGQKESDANANYQTHLKHRQERAQIGGGGDDTENIIQEVNTSTPTLDGNERTAAKLRREAKHVDGSTGESEPSKPWWKW